MTTMRIRKCKTGFMYAKTKVFNDMKKQQQKIAARKKIDVRDHENNRPI